MIAKRVSMSLLAIGAVSLVVSAASFALFTASTTNQNNTFTAGTVTLGTPAGAGHHFQPLAPGDMANMPDITVQYTGNLDAWVGFDATLSGDLVSCDAAVANEFSVNIGGSVSLNETTPSISNVVIGHFSQGQTVTLPSQYVFDIDAGNDCQGDSADLDVVIHAVQSRNNTNGTNTGPIDWN